MDYLRRRKLTTSEKEQANIFNGKLEVIKASLALARTETEALDCFSRLESLSKEYKKKVVGH